MFDYKMKFKYIKWMKSIKIIKSRCDFSFPRFALQLIWFHISTQKNGKPNDYSLVRVCFQDSVHLEMGIQPRK